MLTLVLKHSLSKYKLLTAVVFLLVVGAVAILPHGTSFAFSPNYNSSNLIDNPTLLNNATMSASAIQNFLSNIGSGLAGYSDVEACDSAIAPYYIHCGQTLSAAQLVYDAAQAYGINPEAILSTMQKEQSLVTDPTPSASQINCAMGFHSCGGYVGFFTQVDNGTWVLRYNYEGALQNATWASWYPGSNYPCATAGYENNGQTQLYSTGLYPGSTVVFDDPGGTAETVTLANAATASLYCYTPYVGPASITGYSGSYNFVYYFQLWFGSAQASTPYAWAYEGQAAYYDSAMTTGFTGTPTVAPGQDLYLSLEARNVGYQTWQQSSLHLGTSNPNDRISPFYSSTWLGATRVTGLPVAAVPPGAAANFIFTIQAPQQPGTYVEYYNLVDDGVSWLNGPSPYYTINVVPPQPPTNSQNTGLTTGQQILINQYLLSPDAQSTLNLQPGGDLVLNENFLPAWTNGVSNANANSLTMQGDDNLVEYTSTGTPLWASNTNGACTSINNGVPEGAYLTLQTNGNLAVYCNSGGNAIWSSGTVNVPSHLDYVNYSLPDGIMYPGQSLETANLLYRLVLQGDGNLVEYSNSSGTALWSSGTTGKSVADLNMQPDGNLVLYGTNGQALWTSNTSGKGMANLVLQPDGTLALQGSSVTLWNNNKLYPGQTLVTSDSKHKLTLQSDGNLVLYNSAGAATWASNTAGKPVTQLAMQSDGNLVLYGTNGQALWNSNTSGKGISSLAIQSDGNVVVYTAQGVATWASNTAGK